MTIICPCCGGRAPSIPVRALEAAPVTSTGRLIVGALIRAHPNVIPSDRMVDLIYAGAIIPNEPEKCMRDHLDRARRSIEQCGWTIVNTMGKGRGVRAEYRLMPLEGEQP